MAKRDRGTASSPCEIQQNACQQEATCAPACRVGNDHVKPVLKQFGYNNRIKQLTSFRAFFTTHSTLPLCCFRTQKEPSIQLISSLSFGVNKLCLTIVARPPPPLPKCFNSHISLVAESCASHQHSGKVNLPGASPGQGLEVAVLMITSYTSRVIRLYPY